MSCDPPASVAGPSDYITGISCTIIVIQAGLFISYYPYQVPIQYRGALGIAGMFILGDAATHFAAAASNSGRGNLSYVKLIPAVTSFSLMLMLFWLLPQTLRFLEYTQNLKVKTEQTIRELSLANRRAQHAIEDKDLFISSTSHEIRNPLNVIVTTVGFLLDTILNPDQRELVMTLQDNAEYMTQLVDDTLSITRMESGKLTLERIGVDLYRLARTQIRDLSGRAGMKNIRFELDYPDNVPHLILSDPTRLKQLMLNLLSNAIKFALEDTTILFRISTVPSLHLTPARIDHLPQLHLPDAPLLRQRRSHSLDPTHPIWAKMSDLPQFTHQARSIYLDYTKPEPNEEVALVIHEPEENKDITQTVVLKMSVVDNGVGISPEALVLLFRAYTQAKLSTVRVHGGSGLGLSICAHIMRHMRGCIVVTSEIGRGSEFSFLFEVPALSMDDYKQRMELEPDNAPPKSSPTSREMKRAHSFRDPFLRPILVVDDNEINRKVLFRLLNTTLGYTNIEMANDGLQAINAFKQRTHDHPEDPFFICFMDVKMPHMDGLEATRHLRQMGYSTVIAALTGNVSDEDRSACLEAGMTYFLSKPLKREVVQHIMAVSLGVSVEGRTVSLDKYVLMH